MRKNWSFGLLLNSEFMDNAHLKTATYFHCGNLELYPAIHWNVCGSKICSHFNFSLKEDEKY